MSTRVRKNGRIDCPKGDPRYKQLWRIVDGATRDALGKHPDYLTDKGAQRATACNSIVKRVVGAVFSFAEQSAQERARVAPVRAETPVRAGSHAAEAGVNGVGSGRRGIAAPALFFWSVGEAA